MHYDISGELKSSFKHSRNNAIGLFMIWTVLNVQKMYFWNEVNLTFITEELGSV